MRRRALPGPVPRAASAVALAVLFGVVGAALGQASPGVQPIKPCEPYPACLGGGGGGGSPQTCAEAYASVAGQEPAYGADMQTCCSASASAAGQDGCSGYVVASNTAACGNDCAPPAWAFFSGGALVRDTGWGAGATVQVYVNPDLSSYPFSDGTSAAQVASMVESEMTQAAASLGVTLEFSTTPLPAGTGYTVEVGTCPGEEDACTTDQPTASGTTEYATTVVDFGAWVGAGLTSHFAAAVGEMTEHEFLHSNGAGDDYAAPGGVSCEDSTVMWYSLKFPAAPPTGSVDALDVCAATDGAEDGPGGGGGGSGGGGGGGGGPQGCTTPQPNNSCTCTTEGTWNCECQGTPPCPDATCNLGGWGGCGSSGNVICYGNPPNCGEATNYTCVAVAPGSSQGEYECVGGACNGKTYSSACYGNLVCDAALGELACE